jgi:hypothetical protein
MQSQQKQFRTVLNYSRSLLDIVRHEREVNQALKFEVEEQRTELDKAYTKIDALEIEQEQKEERIRLMEE